MGRAKVTLKRIENERARKLTFVSRKKGLIKKISEFPADACLIIHDIETNAATVTWPQEPEKLNSFLQRYDHLKKKTETRCERFGVKDFFDIKNGIVEAEISKVRKEILKVKYPCWNPGFSHLSVDELRNFIVMLNAKVGLCDSRINMLKQNKQQVEGNYGLIQNMVTESEEVGVVQNCYVPLDEFMELADLQNTVSENSLMVHSHVDVSGPSESRNLPLGDFVECDDLQKSLMLDSQVDVLQPSESRNLPLDELMELADLQKKTVSANSLMMDSQVDVPRTSESRNLLPLGEFLERDDLQKTINENSVMVDSQVGVSRPSESRNLAPGEFMQWDGLELEPLVDHPTPNVWANKLVEDDDWANRLEDWAFQPDISFHMLQT